MNKHPLINEGETNKRKIEEEIKNNKQVKKMMNLKPPPTISDIKKTTTTKQNNRKEKEGKKKGRKEKDNEKTKEIAEPGIKQIKITSIFNTVKNEQSEPADKNEHPVLSERNMVCENDVSEPSLDKIEVPSMSQRESSRIFTNPDLEQNNMSETFTSEKLGIGDNPKGLLG